MIKTIEVHRNVPTSNVKEKCVYEPAKTCPICHTALNGDHVFACTTEKHDVYFYEHSYRRYLYVLHYCSVCGKCFLGIYSQKGGAETFVLDQAVPSQQIPASFPDCICQFSPRFVTIYNQAAEAEGSGLLDICGMGYRLALEVLVKDFCIHVHPDKKATIIDQPLMQCINTYIEHEQLKIAASRSAWLGNDHSHYQAKHTDKDLNYLKRLVSLTVHWVSMVLETEEAEQIQPIK